MEINLNNIRETYGDNVIISISDNIDDVMENIEYLKKLNFTDTEDIFEKYAIIFLDMPSEFKRKIEKLIKEIGHNYVEVIENDLSILEKLL